MYSKVPSSIVCSSLKLDMIQMPSTVEQINSDYICDVVTVQDPWLHDSSEPQNRIY